MSAEIKAGNVVQLKSGGPLMTVEQVGDHMGTIKAWCDWFVQDKPPWKKEDAVFHSLHSN